MALVLFFSLSFAKVDGETDSPPPHLKKKKKKECSNKKRSKFLFFFLGNFLGMDPIQPVDFCAT
jgi:hypothetical protein